MNAVKNITLVTSRPAKEYKVSVSPGQTYSEVVGSAGLDPNEYIALKPSDQTELRPDEEVYPHVGDQSKVHLTMHSEVGRG